MIYAIRLSSKRLIALAGSVLTLGLMLISSTAFAQDNPGREEPDTRVGPQVLNGFGGPDGFGYTWVDSNEPGGPAFDWFDITGLGTEIILTLNGFEEVPLPFTFPFYGLNKQSVKIASHGYLTFGIDGEDWTNDEITDPWEPNDIIAPFWDNIDPSADTGGGSVHYYHDASANRFVVQYTDVPFTDLVSGFGANTFQVQLYPDGLMRFQYLSMGNGGDTDRATVGIENIDGSDGLQIVFNNVYIENNLAVRVLPPAGLSTVSAVLASDGTFIDRVGVTWNDASVEIGYNVYRDGVLVGSPDKNATLYNDRTAQPGVTYTYCVEARLSEGLTGDQSCDTGTLGTLTATDDLVEAYVELTWGEPTLMGSLVQIQRGGTLLSAVARTETRYRDATATPGTAYTYCAVVLHADGSEGAPVCDTGSRKLFRPTGFQASDGTSEQHVSLNWTDRSEIEDGYTLARNPGNALTFDGTDDFVETPETDLTGGFSFAFWARRTGTNGDFIVGQGVSNTDNQGLQVGFSANKMQLDFRGNMLETAQTYTDTDWHHWAVTYNATTLARAIYRDGVLVASDVSPAPYAGSGVLHFGQKAWGLAQFEGELDEMQLWSKALSAGEVKTSMDGLLAGGEAGLTAYWPLDASSGTTARDAVGALSGTLMNMNGTEWSESDVDELRASLPANTASYADATAEPGVVYEYVLAAFVDSDGDGRFVSGTDFASVVSTDEGWRAFVTPPGAVTATDGQYNDRVQVSWVDASTTETQFTLYRDGAEIHVEPAADPAGTGATLFYEDLTAVPGVTYAYCVTSTTGTTESAQACDDGMAGSLAPPETVAASDSTYDDRVRITWADAADTEDGFIILRDGTPLDTTAADVASYSDFGAAQDVTYNYCVRALSLADPGNPANSADVCDDGYRAFVLAPTGVAATDDEFEDEVVVTWTNPATTALLFNLFRDGILYDTVPVDEVAFTDAALASDVAYDYCVQSVTVPGASAVAQEEITQVLRAMRVTTFRLNGEASGGEADEAAAMRVLAAVEASVAQMQLNAGLEVSAMVCDAGSRSILAPTDVAATYDAFEDHAEITWVNTSDVATGFNIYRDGTSAPIATVGPTRTSYGDFAGVPGVAYAYSVTATDAFGESEPGTEAGRRSLKAPTSLHAADAASETLVELTWVDNSRAEDGYRIYRQADGDTDATLIGTTGQSATRFTNDLATPLPNPQNGELGVAYIYQVVAFDAQGESAPAEDVGSTFILPPTNVNASDTYADRVVVTWVDVSGLETGYAITRSDGGLVDVSVGPDATTYIDATAVAGEIYDYCVATTGGADVTSSPVCEQGGLQPVADSFPPFSTGLLGDLSANDGSFNDQFGRSVSVDGDYAIVGADQADTELGNDAGKAYLFKREGSSWTEQQTLSADDGELSDLFGWSVSIDGDYAIIGSKRDDTSGLDAGAVYLFVREGTIWEQHQKLLASDGETADNFGTSVSIDGDYVIIGAEQAGSGTTGAAYIFKREGTIWGQQAILTASDGESTDRFGTSVSIDGDYAIVGAEGDQGAAYIFKREDASWEQQAIITASDGESFDNFGTSVSIDGDYAIVGADENDDSDFSSGSAYLFKREDTSWTERQKLTANDAAGGAFFGTSVSIDGDYAIIGARGDDEIANSAGAAYLYRRLPDGWINIGKLLPGLLDSDIGASEDGLFGNAVALSAGDLFVGSRSYGLNTKGAAFTGKLLVKPSGIVASDGTFTDRVQIQWTDESLHEIEYRIYRRQADGTLNIVGTVGANKTAFDDFSAAPGGSYEYCVTAFNKELNDDFNASVGESLPVCATGWRPPNGSISGRVATLGGGGTEDVQLCLTPNPNRALLFDGHALVPGDKLNAGGHVVVTGSEGAYSWLEKTAVFTLEAWVNFSDPDAGIYQTILGNTYTALNRGLNFGLEDRGSVDRALLLSLTNGSSGQGVNYKSANGVIPATSGWHHVAAVGDGSTVTFYVDGIPYPDVNGVSPPIQSMDAPNPLMFGALPRTGNPTDFFMAGRLDEVRIWNVARDSTAIADAMGMPLTGDEAGLVSYWPFNEGIRKVTAEETGTGYNGELIDGVYFTDTGAPLDGCAITNEAGNYTLSNIRYGESTTFSLTPTRESRTFNPPTKEITLSPESPIQNEVGFTDITAFTVAGVVQYVDAFSAVDDTGGGACPVSNVQLYVTEGGGARTLKATSEVDGTYTLSVSPSDPNDPSDTRRIEAVLVNPDDNADAHTFAPAFYEQAIVGDLAGTNFEDQTRRNLSGVFGGSCEAARDIGRAVVRIFTEDGCYDREVVLDSSIDGGAFEVDLPPLEFLVEVKTVETDSPLRGDIVAFFQNIGAQEVDLTGGDAALDLLYHAPLGVAIAGFDAFLPTDESDNACPVLTFGDEDPLALAVVPVLEQGPTPIPVTINVIEDFGGGLSCPVAEGIVTVYDEIADIESEPVELVIQDGLAVFAEDQPALLDGSPGPSAGDPYWTFANAPNITTGRRVDGVDRSLQKVLTAVAEVPGRVSTDEQWVVVTGRRPRVSTFTTLPETNIPLHILRDPPGDASYSYLEKGSTSCIDFESVGVLNIGAEKEANVTAGLRTIQGFGVLFPSRIALTATLKEGITLSGTAGGGFQTCLTVQERISTSSDPYFTGDRADVFVGVGLNFIFAVNDELTVNSCDVALEEGLGFGFEEDEAFATQYTYTQAHIKNTVIPQLEQLTGTDPENELTYETAIHNWEAQLEYNANEKLGAFGNCQDVKGAVQQERCEELVAARAEALEEANAARREHVFALCMEDEHADEDECAQQRDAVIPIAQPLIENRSFDAGATYQYTHTGDSTDFNYGAFKLDLLFEPGIESETDISGTGPELNVKARINPTWSIERKNTDIRHHEVGYVLEDNDVGDYFTVDVVDDFAITTPIFRLRSGRSSAPWEPGWADGCINLGDKDENGQDCEPLTQPRDQAKLSINPPRQPAEGTLSPDEPAVFTLSLTNLGASKETRHYVLRSIHQSNPGGASLSAQGSLIHNGVTFLLGPDQTQEVTLKVDRGPNRYSYEGLQVQLYPEGEYDIWEDAGEFSNRVLQLADTVSFDVFFDAPCSDVNILQPQDLWTLNAAHTTLDVILDGFVIPVSETDTVATIGLEYRLIGDSDRFGTSWLPAGSISRADLGDAATSWSTMWTPEQDGDYEIRAFTECAVAGPGAPVYSVPLSGIVDTTPPLVIGLPEPADQILAFGQDVSVTFNESVACSSIVTEGAGANVLLQPVDHAGTPGAAVGVEAICNGETVVLTPSLLGGWDHYENQRMQATVLGEDDLSGITPLTDLPGNPLQRDDTGDGGTLEDVHWSFVVQRSALAWSPTNLPLGNAAAVTSTLVNGRATETVFTLEDVPAYLTPSLDQGAIPPGGQLGIDFMVDLSADLGILLPDTLRAATPTGDALLYLTCQAPAWSLDAAAFQYAMSITGNLFIDGLPADDTNDMVAAFVGNQLRGVAAVAAMDGTGALTPMTVYSNTASGETVTFQVFDASDCLTYPGTTVSFTFNNGAVIGSGGQPVAFVPTFEPQQQQITLAVGWSWFSLNRRPTEPALSSVLSTVAAAPGDILKSQSSFSLFDEGAGWVGSVSALAPGPAYQMKLATAGTLVLGGPVVAADSALTLETGWNWLGYLPQVPLDVTTALGEAGDGYVPQDGDVLKSQFGFETFEMGAWMPGTMVMTPGQGYMLFAQGGGTLQYPSAESAAASAALAVRAPSAVQPQARQAALHATGAPVRKVDKQAIKTEGRGAEHAETARPAEAAVAPVLPELSVETSAYRHSMTLIGRVTLDGEPLEAAQTRIWLTDEADNVRGSARLHYVEALDAHRLFLMLYSDAPQGEAFTVHVYDSDSGTVLTLDQRLNFKADHRAGTVAVPVEVAAETAAYKAAQAAAELPEVFSLSQNYPNPFNPVTTVHYALPEAAEVKLVVYDVLGREVLKLVEGRQQAGRYEVRFDAGRLASGVYLYRLEAGPFTAVRRMVLMK